MCVYQLSSKKYKNCYSQIICCSICILSICHKAIVVFVNGYDDYDYDERNAFKKKKMMSYVLTQTKQFEQSSLQNLCRLNVSNRSVTHPIQQIRSSP